MTEKEAQTLVDSSLKRYKLERRNNELRILGNNLKWIGIPNLVMLCLSVPIAIWVNDSVFPIVVHTMATLGGATGATIGTLVEKTNVYNWLEKEKRNAKIDYLKQVKNELNNNVNRFKNTDIDKFDETIENSVKKS